MLDYTKFRSHLWSHRYREAAEEARRLQTLDPQDIGPVGCLAEALLAGGDYAKALPLFGRVGTFERFEHRVPGLDGRGIWISCIHWMLGQRAEAIQWMRNMVVGILDGSIQFSDFAGGVKQGLLLYYMGVTAGDEQAVAKALSYLRTRTKRRAIEAFPGPVARYYLGEVDFADVLSAATRGRAHSDALAIAIARGDLLSRREVCVALFHDGVKGRAQGDEVRCQSRMRECLSLENPLLEEEWYLARYEVEHSAVARVS